jgi:hypothetical protein
MKIGYLVMKLSLDTHTRIHTHAHDILFFHIISSVHSDIKSQIKKPTNALYFHKYSLMPLHMFQLYQAIIRGSKVYIYLTSIVFIQ